VAEGLPLVTALFVMDTDWFDVPVNVGTLAGHEIVCVWAAVGLTAPLLPVADVAASPAAVGTLTGHAIVPAGVNVPVTLLVTECVCAAWLATAVPLAVGTPAGQLIAPSVNAPLALVGTPTGHAIVPVGVTVEVEFVPAGVPALAAVLA
jgi:hypothetical protein